MSFITDLFSGGASTIVDSVGKVLDSVITTKEEKMTLTNEIAKAEMQFQVDMQKLSNEERQMFIQDTGNARERETAIQINPNSTKLGKNVASFLALGTVVLTLLLFYVLIFSKSPIVDEKKDIILYILGVLSATLTQIYSYYFGSSAGSSAKSQTIENLKSIS